MDSPRNVVLITADSIRADHCSAFGYDAPTTPHLSDLASVSFNRAWANAPVTLNSIPSIASGRYPFEDGQLVRSNYGSFVEELDGAGYTTGVITTNPQFARFTFTDHFDHSEVLHDDPDTEGQQSTRDGSTGEITGSGSSESSVVDSVQKVAAEVEDRLLRAGKRALRSGGTTARLASYAKDTYHRVKGPLILHPPDELLLDRAGEWIDTTQEPYFLWLHLMDSHYPHNIETTDFKAVSDSPYDPHRYARLLERATTHIRPGEWVWTLSADQRQYLIDAYDASIRRVDRNVGEFVRELDLDTTTVLFSSDHGKELWDRGHFGHPGRDEIPRDMTLYEEMLHVPLLIVDGESQTRTVDDNASLVQIYPTILDLAGVDYDRERFHGPSLGEYWDGESVSPPDHVVAQTNVPATPGDYEQHWWTIVGAISDGRFKLIWTSNDSRELYDLREDPGEQTDITTERQQTVDELERRLRSHVSNGFSGDVDREPESVDESVKRYLEDLGYVD